MNTKIKAVVFSLFVMPGFAVADGGLDASEIEQFLSGKGFYGETTKSEVVAEKDSMKQINMEIKQQPSAAGSVDVIQRLESVGDL